MQIKNIEKMLREGHPLNDKRVLMGFGLLLLLVISLGFYLFGGRYVSTDNAYIKAQKTPISAEVSGKLVKVNVKDNTRVFQGETLFELDPEPFQIAVNRAAANMSNVRADIESLHSNYLQATAQLTGTDETLRYRQAEYQRYQELVTKQAIAKEQRDLARYQFTLATKEREAAVQAVEVLKAKLDGDPEKSVEANSQYILAKTELSKAQLDLSHAKVLAPSLGTVAQVTQAQGEYVEAGKPLFTLVNENNLWIEANFKETDLTNVTVGQFAEITVDTYPGITLKAKVVSITPASGLEFSVLPAENSSGNWVKVVQRIMVRLEFLPNQTKLPLKSGMSAFVEVDTGFNRFTRMLGFGPKNHE